MYRAYGRDPRQRLNLGIRRRLAPLLDNNRRGIELLNSLLFSLPGTPVIYYGDEIGMGDNVYLGDRNGVRTPMQWRPDRNAGFSEANPQRLYLPVIIDPEHHYEAINVETQQANGSSLLWWMKRLIATRRRHPAFSRGELRMVHSSNHRVFAFIRATEGESILVIANFSGHTQVTELTMPDYNNHVPEELFSSTEFPPVHDGPYTVTIGSNDFYWLLLNPVYDELDELRSSRPTLEITARQWAGLTEDVVGVLESRALVPYIRRSRWFRRKSVRIRGVTVADAVQLGRGADAVWILVVTVDGADDSRDRYVVPLALATGEAADTLMRDAPAAVVAEVADGDQSAVVHDGTYSETFRSELLAAVTGRRRVRGRNGTILIDRSRRLRETLAATEAELPSRVLRTEQSNSSILYGDQLFLKVFRKLEAGINPDVELNRYLSETRGFEQVPPYLADLTYEADDGQTSALGIMISFVANQGNAMEYVRDAIDRYFSSILTEQVVVAPDIELPATLFDARLEDAPDAIVERIDGLFLEMMALLGRRTGELHLALAAGGSDPALKPEAFSRLYQRSLYQSLRSLLRRVLGGATSALRSADEETAPLLQGFLDRESAILERFGAITGQRIVADKIRIHGDYHLEQVLFTGRDFVIIDLEGEPARDVSERRLKFSAFRDVAGMIRSFHYAIYGRYLQAVALRPADAGALQPWIRPWYAWVAGVFLEAYLDTVGDARFCPQQHEARATLLDVFLLEKAIYEIGYEMNNRPGWVRIPLDGITFVLDEV